MQIQSIQPSLPAISKAGTTVALFYFNLRRVAHLSALGIALFMLFVPEPFVYGFAVLAVITEISAWWFRYVGENYHRLSRELMRRAMLHDAFGQLNETLEVTDLLHDFEKEKLKQNAAQLDEKFFYDGYYDSQKTPGIARLLEHLQQSAFWCKHLYKVAARRILWPLGIISLALAFLIFFIVPVAFNGDISLTPKIIVLFLAFVIADELSLALAWLMAAKRSETLDWRLENRIEPEKPSQEFLLAVFADYSVLTTASPPIPNRIYESERDRLNRLWQERMEK